MYETRFPEKIRHHDAHTVHMSHKSVVGPHCLHRIEATTTLHLTHTADGGTQDIHTVEYMKGDKRSSHADAALSRR